MASLFQMARQPTRVIQRTTLVVSRSVLRSSLDEKMGVV
jgi:hypothetical protein